MNLYDVRSKVRVATIHAQDRYKADPGYDNLNAAIAGVNILAHEAKSVPEFRRGLMALATAFFIARGGQAAYQYLSVILQNTAR